MVAQILYIFFASLVFASGDLHFGTGHSVYNVQSFTDLEAGSYTVSIWLRGDGESCLLPDYTKIFE